MVISETPRRGRPGYSRDQVLESAVALFNEQGYDATSVADLSARLGLTKSALYHHFESKEQLLEVAVDSALGGLEQSLDAAMTMPTTAERVAATITGAVTVLTAQRQQVTLLLRLRGNSPVEVAALQRRRAFDQRVTDLLRTAQHEGVVRQDIDAATMTRLVFGMINSIVEWYHPDGAIDPEALATDVSLIVADGLRPR